MAAIDSFRSVGTARPRFFARHWMDVIGVARDWNDARLTRRALGKLTARELDDLGLTRGDIDRIAERR